MRFLETLLLVLVAIYVAQLVITSMVLAALLLFLWCLWKRPREALVLGLGVLLVAFISKPIGLALVVAVAAGVGLWALLRWRRTRFARKGSRPCPFAPPPRVKRIYVASGREPLPDLRDSELEAQHVRIRPRHIKWEPNRVLYSIVGKGTWPLPFYDTQT